MARYQRDIFENGCFYHMYNKVVSEVTLFAAQKDYHIFLERYHRYFSEYFDTYAYCLIPNHYHFLVRVKDDILPAIKKENTLAATQYINGERPLNFVIENQLSRMFSGIAMSFNKRHSRVGPVFKEGTKRVLLKTESRIIHQLCYIHHNPIHHKLVTNYKDWSYSSYRSYICDDPSSISKTLMLNIIGGTEVFHQLHDDFKLDQNDNLFLE